MSEPTPPDPIEEYLRAIEAIPSLTSNEERELLIAAKSGDDDGSAKRRLIEAHLRVVVQIAHQNEGRGMRFLNLVEEGNLGLIRAVELFDPSTGGEFGPFAEQQINKAITHALG